MESLLVEVTRGELVESRHYGDIAVVNNKGNLIASVGNPEMVTFLRSAAKPLQAIPIAKSDALDSFSLNDQHLAVMTGSHTGEKLHCNTVREILERINATPADLCCGNQWPTDRKTANELVKQGEEPSTLHNNCSGKHAGMMLLCRYHNWPLENYRKIKHPVQQLMLKEVAENCSIPPEKIKLGVDGCGVPVFAMPLLNMASGFAHLVSRSENQRVVKAMTSYPEMVFGSGRLDTVLMQSVDNLVAKTGAEAVYCMGLADKGIGIAIKISDGSIRALGPTAIEVLHQLGVLDPETLSNLKKFHCPEVLNRHKEIVGVIRPSFQLSY